LLIVTAVTVRAVTRTAPTGQTSKGVEVFRDPQLTEIKTAVFFLELTIAIHPLLEWLGQNDGSGHPERSRAAAISRMVLDVAGTTPSNILVRVGIVRERRDLSVDVVSTT